MLISSEPSALARPVNGRMLISSEPSALARCKYLNHVNILMMYSSRAHKNGGLE